MYTCADGKWLGIFKVREIRFVGQWVCGGRNKMEKNWHFAHQKREKSSSGTFGRDGIRAAVYSHGVFPEFFKAKSFFYDRKDRNCRKFSFRYVDGNTGQLQIRNEHSFRLLFQHSQESACDLVSMLVDDLFIWNFSFSNRIGTNRFLFRTLRSVGRGFAPHRRYRRQSRRSPKLVISRVVV